tara:strand:- start:228560 stop:230830 length:2271 start_codon:yes stop_codon:yes gene_type:complete
MSQEQQSMQQNNKREAGAYNVPPSQRYSHVDSDAVRMDLRRLLMTLWRRRYVIVTVIAMMMALAYFGAERITPLYKSGALVLVNEHYDSTQNDSTQMLNEVEIIRSRALMMDVIKRLDLYTDPVFAKDLDFLRTHHENHNNVTAGIGFKSLKLNREGDHQSGASERSKTDKWRYEKELGLLINRVVKNLEIRPIKGAAVLSITYASPSPERAKRMVDVVADVYVSSRLNKKFEATRKITKRQDARLSSLRKQLRDAEHAVEAYRANNSLISGALSDVTGHQMSEVSRQLVLARTRLTEARTQLSQISGWAEEPLKIESIATLSEGHVLSALKLKQNEIEQEYADLFKRYGEKHPELIRITAERENIKEDIGAELLRAAAQLENNLTIELSRTKMLASDLAALEEKRKIENQSALRLRELEGEAAAIRQVFETFLGRYKNADHQDGLSEADAQVLSYASIPQSPFYPNKPLLLSVSALLGLIVALGLIIILESLANTYRSALKIEKDTGLICVGAIPSVKVGKNENISDYVIQNPTSVVTEALRSMKTVVSLNQKNQGKPLDVLAITSSLPSEGKSTISVWLARLLALSGKRVLLIDCDLRRPAVHNIMDHKNDLSLVEYLTDKAKMNEVICKDPVTGLEFILGRSVSNTALDLLTSERMEDLIKTVRKDYDLVILDTPACMAVSDSCVLAGYADHVIYAVCWDKTPRDIALSGLKKLRDLGFNDLTVAFSLVDLKRQAKYGYGETGYYYSDYTDGA